MDMDSSHQNWLAFSLSNHSLFHPLFNSTTNPSASCGVVDQENGGAGGPTTDHHLPLPGGGGPKLEDFLGASGGSSGGHTAAQYDTGAQGVNMSDVEIYGDSELKTIAAGFLRGFSNEQSDAIQKQVAVAAPPPPEPPVKKTVETFGQRTSIFRGVTRHRWTGRYEAHLWDNSCRREGQSRKGRQVYLGGYDKEEKAARAYDLAALKYWGPTTTTNFPVSDYEKEMEEMKHMTRQEFVASLRRKSSGFSRGASIYRGVTRHHQHGRWQARIGRVAGNKDLYLGTFSTQEEAAEAYDIAAIKFRGLNAVTNFDMSRYDVRSIASSNLPIGGVNNKSKSSSESISDNKITDNSNKDPSSTTSVSLPSQNSTATINFALPIKQDHSTSLWNALGHQNFTNNTKNPNTGISHFQQSNFNMEFQANNNDGFLNSCSYFQDQENGTNSTNASSLAPTLADPNNGAVTDDAVLCNANWMAPLGHSYQTAKNNLSSFQTPIFGME